MVEFGPRVRARAITAGGASGNPASRHFTDEAARYAAGACAMSISIPSDLKGHTERVYRPGE